MPRRTEEPSASLAPCQARLPGWSGSRHNPFQLNSLHGEPTRFAPPLPMRVASSGQSICLGKQQVTERLEPDLAAVKAADDAVDRSPLPDRHGVHTSMGRQPLRPGMQVVTGVRVASDDGAEVACSLSAQTHWIDELERAVRRLEHVEVVDVAVDEHSLSVIVGPAATLHAPESVLDGCS